MINVNLAAVGNRLARVGVLQCSFGDIAIWLLSDILQVTVENLLARGAIILIDVYPRLTEMCFPLVLRNLTRRRRIVVVGASLLLVETL